jgi:hypothetical protein
MGMFASLRGPRGTPLVESHPEAPERTFTEGEVHVNFVKVSRFLHLQSKLIVA